MKKFQVLFLVLLTTMTFGLTVKAANALTVSPVRVEIALDPGATYRGEYKLFNDQPNEVTIFNTFENFEAKDDTGTPVFTNEEVGLASWLEGPAQITLGVNEEQKVPFSITVPPDTDPGGYFAAIFWADSPPEVDQSTSGARIASKLGILVLLRVNGDITEAGGITEFQTTDQKKLYQEQPLEFTYKFGNQGGDRIKPDGTIRLKGLLGKGNVIDANAGKGNVLPGQIRTFKQVWGDQIDVDEFGFFDHAWHQVKHFKIGPYKAILELEFGSEDQRQTASATYKFFMLPWQGLAVLIVLFLVVIFGGRWMIRSYNRWVIAQAKRQIEQARNLE